MREFHAFLNILGYLNLEHEILQFSAHIWLPLRFSKPKYYHAGQTSQEICSSSTRCYLILVKSTPSKEILVNGDSTFHCFTTYMFTIIVKITFKLSLLYFPIKSEYIIENTSAPLSSP